MDKYLGLLLDNRYEILNVIGMGGMAVVYRARCRLLNRYVAIKILKDEFASDADFRRRFHTEAQAVAKLQHTNIVSVYDVNRTDNIEYIVMELVEGITLKEYMDKKGALSVSEFLHFAPQIAAALEHAHNRGIIHRDIKPQNIIILRDGSLKVTDFGIARFAQNQQVTMIDEALGSVHYVSPEQARGSQIDARSDIYSFGVMMYEMLTGRLPFEGDTPVAVVLQHINSIPLAPREIDPSIPEALEQIIIHAMSANIDNRYSSAAEILRDFERFQRDSSIIFAYNVPSTVSSAENTQKFSTADIKKSQPAADTNATAHSDAAAHARTFFNKKPAANPAPRRLKNEDDDDYEPYLSRRRTSIFVYIVTGILTAAIFLGGAAFIITTIFGTAADVETDEFTSPNLIGQDLRAVLASSDYSMYNIVESETLYSDTFDEGVIISQKPVAGRTIKADTTINVTVSLGAKKVMLPDLTNVEYRTAQLRLSSLDFMYTNEYEVSDTITEGYVIRTSPDALTQLTPGSVVKLVISIGRDEVMTIAPNLAGLTESRAERMLQAAGLVLGEVIPMESDAEEGTVVAQSVAADAEVPEKSAVDIYIASHSIADPDSTTSVDGASNPNSSTDPSDSSGDVKGTYVLAVKLPSDKRDKVLVTVKSGSEVIHEQEYETSLGIINITLRGNGSILAQVYFDGVFYADQVVIFD
ncbi:MAG: Stk1 family PASTA domain-containing Ser/Thr kinase [Clostridiaceae bacterium]|nr:Stk1 family PASTA domain-containing Ser/Thr kinase [Clostridiaceae bacterium]